MKEVGFRADHLSPAVSSVWWWICNPYKAGKVELKKCDTSIDNILHNVKTLHVSKLAFDSESSDRVVLDLPRAKIRMNWKKQRRD